ncbi:transmembrane protein 80 isoform 2-T2 [Podargus strigoides]
MNMLKLGDFHSLRRQSSFQLLQQHRPVSKWPEPGGTGVHGNLTEEEAPLGLSLVITVGSVILSVYFLVWQTYVLRADVIVNSLLLVLYGLEVLLKVTAIAAFVS